jgi:hypothetical protein
MALLLAGNPAVLVAVITVIGGILIAIVKRIISPGPKPPKVIQLVLFVKDRASDKPLRALVILERSTGHEERITDGFGVVKFEVAPKIERSLRAEVTAERHQDQSVEIGALTNDKSYNVFLDPN